MSLRTYLKSLGPGPVYYKPNPGNGGDALIAHATYQCLDHGGIDVRVWSEGEDAAGKVVLYGGGGNLVEYYEGASRFIAEHHDRAERLVILPHTISGHSALLGALGPNVVIFCRELRSYRYVRGAAPRADVRLAHDLALELDPEDVLATRPDGRGAAPRYRRRLAKFERAWSKRLGRERRAGPRRSNASRTLNAFREDLEKTGVERPADNIDLSTSVPVEREFLEPGLAHLTSHLIFDSIRPYDRVRTNRLHVAIAAALLGKHVQLHDNAYWKNRAVYEHSLAARFPRVVFEPSDAVPARPA